VSREGKAFLTSVLFGGLVSCASTIPLWRDVGEVWGGLLLFSLPGLIVAFPLGAMGIGGNAHDPSAWVTAFVDFLFYSRLIYWLMTRRRAREG
jgi:hypothetical protein